MAFRGLLPLVAAVLLGLAACGGDETTTVTETVVETETVTETAEAAPEEPAETPAPELAQECENPDAGYTISFPADWHTTTGDTAEACAFFHPEPFEVPANTDAIGMAILLNRQPVPFDRVTGEDPATEVVSSEETEVDGHPAIRRETEATGDGLFPAGQRGYQYVVDLDGETLLASTHDAEGLDYEENREVLDAMVETLRFD